MIDDIILFFKSNSTVGLGIIITIAATIFLISELNTYIKHKSPSDQLIFWLMSLITGVTTIIFVDFVFGLLLGISLLMVVETAKIWSTPVWGKLMAATTSTYLLILLGKAGQIWYNWYFKPETPNEAIFTGAYNLAFPVFLLVSFIFFGRKFLLVSKFSSPNIVYLFLFSIVYGGIIALRGKIFPVDDNGLTGSWDYLNINSEWTTRVIFADFGTFEALTIVMIFLYLISGWLLTVLMGVKPVTDPELLAKVREISKKMGIKEEIKVGFTPAPILNAFAYGPFFDKRIAFIAGDINDFTDADIRGIVGHELAHASRHHILILLILSILELAIKKALHLPATALDYTLLPDDATASGLDFAGYFAFSYLILVFLFIAVRILEGDADKKTKDAGYGEDLTQALFRLEGFYNGVASDFGISVNLLTDRRYSLAEKRRFTAQAAGGLYKSLLSPSRMSAFGNIFQSHPKTMYRISNLVMEDRNPRKGALLPYRLLGFFKRKAAIKELSEAAEAFHTAIDKSYLHDFGEEALTEVMEYNTYQELYSEYIDQNVILFNVLTNEVITGKLSELVRTNRVTSPYYAKIDGKDIDLAIHTINVYNLESEYFLKDGKIVILKGYELEDKKLMIKVESDGITENIEFKKLGKPVKFITDLQGKEVIHFEKGLSRLKTIKEIELNGSWGDSSISLDNGRVKGNDLIVSFSPLGFEIRKNMREEQLPLLNSLIGKKIAAYTKENFDVSITGILKEVDTEYLIILDADGEQKIVLDDLQYVITTINSIEIITKSHISLFTKLGIWWSNRKEFNYILAK